MLTRKFNNKGAIVVEATFIIPIVLIVMMALIYLGILQIQQGVMYLVAQNMSNKIASEITFPGYGALNDTSDIDYTDIKGAFGIIEPYRYLGYIYSNDYGSSKDKILKIAENMSFFKLGNFNGEIEVKFINLSSCVDVSLNYEFKLPKTLKYIGIKSDYYISTEAITCLEDASEFVRNMDLIVDLSDDLLEKYMIKDKIEIFYDKVTGALEGIFK